MNLEILETRALLSGGPGPSVLASPLVSTGKAAQSQPSAILTPAPLATQGSAKPLRLDDTLPPPGQAGISWQELFSGYPLPPGAGPALTGSLTTTAYVSALPVSLQQSAVAVIPVSLTGLSNSTILTMTPPTGYTISVLTLNTPTGLTNFMVVTPTGVPVSTVPTGPAANSAGHGGH